MPYTSEQLENLEHEHELRYADPVAVPKAEIGDLIDAYRELVARAGAVPLGPNPWADERGDWMQTASGGRFYPLAPSILEIEIEDIARALAMTCRYGGHVSDFYSVAEHSVIVSCYVPIEFRRQALLHDAAEAYIGDMIRPLKHAAPMAEFARVERTIEAMIFERFAVTPTDESTRAVKAIDDRILRDEADRLLKNSEWAKRFEPLGVTLACLSPKAAERVFLNRFRECFLESPQ